MSHLSSRLKACESMIQILQSEMRSQFATLLLQVRAVVADELEADSARWREVFSKGTVDPLAQLPEDCETASKASDGKEAKPGADDANQLEWPELPHQPQPPQLLKPPGVELRRNSQLKKGSSRMDCFIDRSCPSKTADIRHSLLHSIAELEHSKAPLNHQLRNSVTAIFTTFPPPLHKVNTWISEELPDTRLSKIRMYFQQRVVETTLFETVVIFMICMNTVMIGVNCDWNLTHLNEEEPRYFQVVERFFAIIFALELFLRVFAYGSNFFCGRSEPWRGLTCCHFLARDSPEKKTLNLMCFCVVIFVHENSHKSISRNGKKDQGGNTWATGGRIPKQ